MCPAAFAAVVSGMLAVSFFEIVSHMTGQCVVGTVGAAVFRKSQKTISPIGIEGKLARTGQKISFHRAFAQIDLGSVCFQTAAFEITVFRRLVKICQCKSADTDIGRDRADLQIVEPVSEAFRYFYLSLIHI